MPVGGKETGFYRYPKKDERILVDNDGNTTNPTYYLMGFLPSATDPDSNFLTSDKPEEKVNPSKEEKELFDKQKESFDDEKKLLEGEEGMVLRYRQTGKHDSSAKGVTDRYSEIGFYRRKTQWKAPNEEYKDFTEAVPRIDQLNIQSTGDIHTKAKNHHLMKAKRFELLVDAENGKLLPLGDNPGDDSGLHAGDVHIRAKNRVVIKAGKEIVLQVGKTVLKISDGGFNIVSKMINSNVSNPYDTTVNINNGGISLFGFNVTINSVSSFGIADAFGGGIGSRLGIVSIGGREIKAEAYDSAQFKSLVSSALMTYALSAKAGVEGITGLSMMDMVNEATDSEFFNKIKDTLNGRKDNETGSGSDSGSDSGSGSGSGSTDTDPPKESKPSSTSSGGGDTGTTLYASPLDIITFVVEYGYEIYSLGKRLYGFVKKIVGLTKQFEEIQKKIRDEKTAEVKKKAENAEAEKAAAVKKAEEKKKAAVEKAEEKKKAAVKKAEDEEKAAVRQAQLDQLEGKITQEEADKRIKDAEKKREMATDSATYQENREVASANFVASRETANAERNYQTTQAEAARVEAIEAKNTALETAKTNKETTIQKAKNDKETTIQKATEDLDKVLNDTTKTPEERKAAVSTYNDTIKAANDTHNKTVQEANETHNTEVKQVVYNKYEKTDPNYNKYDNATIQNTYSQSINTADGNYNEALEKANKDYNTKVSGSNAPSKPPSSTPKPP
jgi:hypothetical protein